MKLTSVEIHSSASEMILLSFRDPRGLNPYSVKSILGLDTDSIVARQYGASNFYSLSLEKRVITIKMGLNPSFTDNVSYSDLRDSLYKIISSSRTGRIQLYFKNGEEVVAVLYGFVAKLETPHFEKDQEVQLTIDCDEPTLKALNPIYVPVGGFDLSSMVVIDDKSTAPHGFAFTVGVTHPIDSIKITDPYDTSWGFEVIPVGGFVLGDEIHYSSELNNKHLYLVRGGITTTQLADRITIGSIWPIMFPGNNRLAFTNPTQLRLDTFSYYPTYWGV